MSKSKSKSKKKVVLTKKENKTATKAKVAPTTSRRGRTAAKALDEKLLFNKDNFTMILGGLALVLIGMIMMLGGSMPDANTWDPDIIYSTRITVVGPILIIAGLVVEIYAIFKK